MDFHQIHVLHWAPIQASLKGYDCSLLINITSRPSSFHLTILCCGVQAAKEEEQQREICVAIVMAIDIHNQFMTIRFLSMAKTVVSSILIK